MIEPKKIFFATLVTMFLMPHLFAIFQENEPDSKKDDIYNTYLKIKNNFKDEKFWNSSEISKDKQKIKYDEFDNIKKNLIKQIIIKACKNSICSKASEEEKKTIRYKDTLNDLDDIDRKLKADLYKIKPEWFTELDKEIFLEIKK
jgi:hypothetical protein